MKSNKRKVIGILLTVILCLLLSVTAFASESPASTGDSPITTSIEESEDSRTAPISEQRDLPEGPVTDKNTEASDTEQSMQEAPVKKRNSNTPLFIGAGFSVLLFIGVVIFCKIKGNK